MSQTIKFWILLILLYFCVSTTLLFPTFATAQTLPFSDNFDSGSGQWSVATGTWTIQNIDGSNRYGTSVPTPFTCCSESVGGSTSWNNYIYEVDLLGRRGVDKNLLFRYLNPTNKYGLHFAGGNIYLEKFSTTLNAELTHAPFTAGNFDVNGIVYRIKVAVNGNNIKVYIDNNLYMDYTDTNSPILNGMVGFRVGTGAVYPTEVWYDNVLVTEIPTPTPIPTTKVIFSPGFGGSWNADAILNCKTSGYSGGWSLAPYAKSIYQPILDALPQNGWQVTPFYYDWRRPITENGNNLSPIVDSSLSANEKLDLVGHSMGGLVGRAYLESHGNAKVDSYYSVGTPHKGVPISYPAWSGGDLWNDNLLINIAANLLIHRCPGFALNPRQVVQNIIPSIQNTLPVFDYLKNNQNGTIKPVGSMNAQNNWLPGNPAVSFDGVRTGTLSGNSFPTLKFIRYKNPSSSDLSKGNWLDGKPAGKEKVSDGDGSVLIDSSQLAVAEVNDVISKNHANLISSNEGIQKILNFLGTAGGLALPLNSQAKIPVSSEGPNSALVIIGYPANFWVADPKGKIAKDTDSIVSIDNPKKGDYKLTLLPGADKTLFIVMQLLPNGETLYKEYYLSNRLPKFKTIKLDFDHPKEDVLN